MTLKRAFTALILVLMMILSACAPTHEPPKQTDTDGATAETTEAITTGNEDPNRKITLYDGKGWACGAVLSSTASDAERQFITSLQGDLSSFISAPIPTSTDKEQSDDVGAELIVGYTAHPAMRSLYASLSYGEACIRVVGGKILVASYTPEGFNILLYHLFKAIRNGRSNGRIEATVSELETHVSVDPYLNRIPKANVNAVPSITDCGINQTLLLYKGVDESAYEGYVSSLDTGTCVQTSSERGNHFSTFTRGDDTLNVSYSKSEGALRLIYTVNVGPTELFNRSDVEKVCEPLLIMRGMGWEVAGAEPKTNGLCIIIRLSDGRFIIVDGGWDRQRDADDLYKLLSENTPKGMKVTVAAWIITHAHEDHHSTFAFDFPDTYRGLVTVENVIFNPPFVGGYVGSNPSGHATNEKEVITAIGKFGARLVRAHVGDKYYVGDAVIDILYTADLICPEKFEYYNTSSLMLMISVAEQRIMITGDGSNVAFDRMASMFGQSLKCDIVQVAHHGYGTGVSAKESTGIVRGYTYMSPTLVLWPASSSGYQSGISYTYNTSLIRLPTVKKIIVAGEKDHIIDLPYKVG